MTLRASVSDVDRHVADEILQHLAKLSGDATLTIRKITAGSVIIEFEGTKAGAEKIRSLELNGLLKEVLGFEIDSIRMIRVPFSAPAVFQADESVTPIPEPAKKRSTTVQRRGQQPEYVPPPVFDAEYLRASITEQLLHAWSAGDRSVEERLFHLVLPNLRNLARALMRRERRDHTLEPTELVNEVYVRLLAGRKQPWESRGHFFSAAARIMRGLLIDHARGRTKPEVVPLISSHALSPEPAGQIELAIAVDRLLDELQASHPEWCSIVELKYFVGLTDQETAEALGLRLRTTQRQFSNARRWLFERLNPSTSKT
jgi:RNA polymerase sigma factor (TIGR02999 family)